MNKHLAAVLQALFAVFLWATSWVFIKIGLDDIPPLIFAGLRYLLAFVCLLPLFFLRGGPRALRSFSKGMWFQLIVLGLLFYAATQGASFVALAYLPAVTVNLLWNFSSVMVAILGIAWLSERPKARQWAGVLLATLGAGLYFYPVDFPQGQMIGVFVALGGVVANAFSSILGRKVNRLAQTDPLVITTVTMGIGALTLFGGALYFEGFPALDAKSWAIILWLAVINTAFAFTLWNHTLRTLSAMESSVINGTMLIWIPIFAVLFLGETITPKELLGLLVAGIGTLLVQLKNPIENAAPFDTQKDATQNAEILE